jgi:hypothetical protein
MSKMRANCWKSWKKRPVEVVPAVEQAASCEFYCPRVIFFSHGASRKGVRRPIGSGRQGLSRAAKFFGFVAAGIGSCWRTSFTVALPNVKDAESGAKPGVSALGAKRVRQDVEIH